MNLPEPPATELPEPPRREWSWTRKFVITFVIALLVVGAFVLFGSESKDDGPITWAEFVYSHGGPGEVCDVLFSEVPDHLAEQWGRRCITGAG